VGWFKKRKGLCTENRNGAWKCTAARKEKEDKTKEENPKGQLLLLVSEILRSWQVLGGLKLVV
jgi:hypothetical protein